MVFLKRILALVLLLTCIALCIVVYALWSTPRPVEITYGLSFNTLYARELGVPWEEVYAAILDDLEVRHLRLAAHWPMVQPAEDTWNFDELDTQVRMAEERGAKIVFAVGRRLPRWPECHVPEWAAGFPWDEQKEYIRQYLRAVVERYKEYTAITHWQVENEPFLTVYAQEQCGELDKTFLDEEIALVTELDPTRPILITDSGNLGLWYGAYKRGDSFGTSVYLYLWNEQTGPLKSVLPPETYVVKRTLMQLMYGKKETMLIELSAEPWLNKPITETELAIQYERMNVEKFQEVVAYAKRTRFAHQYLWGAEWWYWLKEVHNDPLMWDAARALYHTSGE